jgi:PAS domain-containing protein
MEGSARSSPARQGVTKNPRGNMADKDTHLTPEKTAWKDTHDNLKNILDSMQDGVYIVDKNHNIQYVNPALVADFGRRQALFHKN